MVVLLLHFVLVFTSLIGIYGNSIKKTVPAINETLESEDVTHNFNRPIIDVIKENGLNKEEVYEKNLFSLTKDMTTVEQSRVVDGFQFNPDLNSYIVKHSYMEVMWCFKLYKEMTFYKTFEKISSLERSNQFTIYSATGKKQWPSGNKSRHEVCDEISKQPITSGLYEEFLAPARVKALHITAEDFESIKKLFGIRKMATRLEFAQALKIDIVEKRIKPKIVKSIENKLKTLSYESIILSDDRKNGNHGNKPQQISSMLKLIADAYHIPQHSLYSVLSFYINKPKQLAILNEATFKDLAHFTKNPTPLNVTFGDMFTQTQGAMADLERMLKMPLVLALDKNHIQHSIVNKSLLNIMIITAKEPGDIITSYYEMPEEIRKFIETTRMSKFHILMSQSKIRLEHLSIDFFVKLLKKQTVESIRNSILRYDPEEIDRAYIDSVKNIVNKSSLIDFQRIYHKSWSKQQLEETSLLSISIHQGLTGNEFLEVYGMASKNITEITMFVNFTFGMLETEKERDILSYTLKELGEIIKKEIREILAPVSSPDMPTEAVTKTTTRNFHVPEIEAESDDVNRSGTPKALVAIPVVLCILGSISGMLAWIYHARKKELQSAW